MVNTSLTDLIINVVSLLDKHFSMKEFVHLLYDFILKEGGSETSSSVCKYVCFIANRAYFGICN